MVGLYSRSSARSSENASLSRSSGKTAFFQKTLSLGIPRFGQATEGTPPEPIQPEGFYKKPNPIIVDPAQNKRFVVVGDSGAGEPFVQKFVGVLQRLFEKTPFASVLMLGDNVYGQADLGRHDLDGSPSMFESRIKQPFQTLLQKGVQLFGILGNHDVRGKEEVAQLQYLGVPRFYSFTRGNTDFFALDTTILLPHYDSTYKDRTGMANDESRKMLSWLDTALRESKSKYRVVMGHYPMYCSGRYNNRGINAELIRMFLQPLLIKHQVDLYLCGHEHHYERSEPIYGLRHILSGSASKMTKKIKHAEDPPYPRAKLERQNQIMILEETDAGLTFQAINPEGTVIDSGLIPARERTPLDPATNPPNQSAAQLFAFVKKATEFLHPPESEAS
jgi:tartrate-resistant acid phosphatase type 5